ncbi:MAG TPA: TIR domain-containing protein [Phycisphaerae bacterium]|nr:TIR domain-containing protein [Phycisphaerae bacterium]
MSLPIRTTLEDIQELCRYFSTKATGSTIKEARAVLDSKRLDGRKLSALKLWRLIEEPEDGRYRVTPDGRKLIRGAGDQAALLTQVIRDIAPYNAVIERAAHQHEDSVTATDIAALWHEHFRSEVADTDKILKNQAVCFFQVAMGANLGNLIVGRRGASTRFSFNADALKQYIMGAASSPEPTTPRKEEGASPDEETPAAQAPINGSRRSPRGEGIFVAHGKNKKPLEQLKKILEQFKIPYKVAIDEPNLGRPISSKVREIMESCNCAILIFTADEEFRDKNGNTIWRPSENVVYELGATGYLYDNRIVIMKEEDVTFPGNFRDIGYISFDKDQLEARALDIIKELIGFGIVKVST